MSGMPEQHGIAGQVMSQLRRHKRRGLGLRMTPMIDVIFLLLTFFVLTAQFDRPEHALPLVFGQAASVQPQPSVLEVEITPHADGCTVRLSFEDQPLILIRNEMPAEGLSDMAELLRSAHLDSQTPIRLHCHDAVSWQSVTKIYDVLYGLGARDITFIIED